MARDLFPKRIDARWLKRREACGSGLAAFRRAFPKGAPLTLASLRRAARDHNPDGLNVMWFSAALRRPLGPSYEAAALRYRAAMRRSVKLRDAATDRAFDEHFVKFTILNREYVSRSNAAALRHRLRAAEALWRFILDARAIRRRRAKRKAVR